jgi:hypothetical protein
MRLISLLLLSTACAAFTVLFDKTPRSESPRLHRRDSLKWLFFVSSKIIDLNSTAVPLMEWELISHMTVTPEQCNTVSGIIRKLDEALQRSNPEVGNITSSAFRLGNRDCGRNNTCPCGQASRRALVPHLLLEVKTRSPAPTLQPPHG